MTQKSITGKELVELVNGPEQRPIDYRFNRRVFRGRLRSPGQHIDSTEYKRNEDYVLPKEYDGTGN